MHVQFRVCGMQCMEMHLEAMEMHLEAMEMPCPPLITESSIARHNEPCSFDAIYRPGENASPCL